MSVSVSELNELEAFFASMELPEKILIASGVMQNNLAAAVKDKISLIRSGEMAPRLENIYMDHLRAIRSAILAQG